MTFKQHIRMTASEIAMGRLMRAPDHSASDFDTAFADFASPDDKKPDDAAAAGTAGGEPAAAAGGGDGGAGATDAPAGGGSDSAAGGGGDGGAGAGAGDAASGADDTGAAGAGSDGKDQKAGEAPAGGAAAAGTDGGAAGDDKGAAAGDAGAAGAAAATADQPGGAGPSPDQILAGLKKLVGEAKAADAAPAATDDQPAAKPVYNAEEQQFLDQYEKDWGDVAKGEALKRRAEYQALLQHVFTQVANFVRPIQETAEALAQRTFTTDVKSAVPDYSDNLRNDVIEWVKSQPTYLQVAYNHVIEEGTVDEVKDLVERYRTATGKAAPKPAGAGGEAPKSAGKGNELSDEAKKAAAALAPVDSKRSGVTDPGDPGNFEDAWKQALTDLG